jgi:SAM-dependent methyltransferase
MKTQIEQLLINLDIIEKNSIETFFPRTRDNENVQVKKCKKSGVIFLSSNDHLDYSHYENWKAPLDHDIALQATFEDDLRRSKMFFDLVKGKSYLDFGTELGGILELYKDVALDAHGLELQNEIRQVLTDKGFLVYKNIKDIPENQLYDVVSLFHVFEHLLEPMETLSDIKKIIKPGGTLIIEVPHARDFLFNQMDLESFKESTFWSEHIILHTKESLRKILVAAGFKNVKVEGFQRYPLANHLHWLRHNQPGGQKEWKHLSNGEINNAYQKLLQEIDETDTIIATATK